MKKRLAPLSIEVQEVAGLSWQEAASRLAEWGPNIAVPRHVTPWSRVLWTAFHNPFNYILLFLATVSYLTDDLTATTVMLIMVGLATTLRFSQEYRALVKAESLRRLVRNRCTVWRTGAESATQHPTNSMVPNYFEVPVEELVPGDVIHLSAGDMVPADVHLIDSRDLFVSQSTLTGEALPVEKIAGPAVDGDDLAPFDHPHLCFLGSSVISGKGTALVLETGPRTQMGRLGISLSAPLLATAFDKGVNHVSWVLIKFMMVMVPIVFLINGLSRGDWLEAFFFAVAVAVGLTPEMLPMIVNTNLARGAAAMAREKTVVKNIAAIQNFGTMDVLCTDKTGTLTQDKVVLIKHLDPDGESSERVLEHAYLNSLHQSGLKNLIDRAIIEHGNQRERLRELARTHVEIDELPFDFARRRMSVIFRQTGGGTPLLICKGAVDEILEACSQVERGDVIEPLTAERRRAIKQWRDATNEDGMRLIGVAYKAADKQPGDFSVADESDLIFSGFISFLDPPKESAAEALHLLAEHGVEVKILTGDSALVARKVCRVVDLPVKGILSGAELRRMDDEALRAAAPRTTLFAKLDPEQKARVVRALQQVGHTVGYMGDGINDAPALRTADVGISVDSGTDLAKEAADIILLEKSLLVLEKGVIEGRRTFGNIIKYVKMAASSNFGNVLSVLVASAFLPFLPMLAIHLLIQNLLYDIAQISMPWDRMDDDWLKRPRRWEATGIAPFMLSIGPISSIFDITTFLGLWFLFNANAPEYQSLFHSGWFVEGLLSQTLIVHMIRTEKIPFLQSRAATPVLVLTGLIMVIGCLIPFTAVGQQIGLAPLPAAYWPFLIITLLSYCVLIQWVKQRYLRKFGKWL